MSQVRKFRKRPVVIEALLWDGEDFDGLDGFMAGHWGPIMQSHTIIQIFTLEGAMKAQPGDWIIRGVAGEFYPCKAEIFEQTYEAVEA